MRSNLLILFAVLSFILLSCEPKDKWINQYDSKANAGDIAKICKQVSVECGKTKINYSGVDFEINCGECSNGYECRYNTCWDINECENPDLNNCSEHSTCANEEGTYSCICDDNYTWIDSECVEKPQEEPDTDDSGDSTPDNTSDSTDDSDSAPDNSDSTPDDDADTADSIDDSGDSEPDDSDTSDDADTYAPDEDDTEPDEEPTTRTETCSGLPANASWHNGSSITQTFDGNDWYPPATGFYSETAVANECGFKCNQGYNWNSDWGKCFIRPAFGNICTGQTNCYNNSEEITCPTSASANFYGQDAQYAKLGYCYPQSFTLKTNASGENVVVDNYTGLEWQQVLSEETFTWEDAITHCENLNYGGYTDWRLPDPIELLPIVNHSKSSPAVDALYFQISSDAWSSKSHNTTNALSFGSDFGSIWYRKEKTSPLKAMCVRGNKLTKPTFTTSTINGDVVVKDSITGLIWQQTYVTGKTWQEALKYCEDLTYAGKSDWRVPNKNEQASLLNFEKSIPYSDFPDMPKEKAFWTNSTNAEYEHKIHAWHTNFSYGTNTDKKKISDPYFVVRCVRSERINDPCENHICGSVAHSRGICIPENAFEYSCGCDEGYFWNGIQCKIMPECSASSGTPCKDSINHLTWSPLASNDMTQPNALNYCENLVLYGFSDWHLPTIDELRTLIKNCPGTETNGACAISEKNGKLSESDSSSSCSCTHMNNNGGYYSKIGDDDTVSPWSSSSRSDDTERAWYVGFFNGSIRNSQKIVTSDVRCVR